MISQTAEHALRAVVFLARKPQGTAVAATRIARAIDAPANYLGKTLQLLAKRGIVSGIRGPAGGFRLARPAGSITLADVCDVFAEPRGSHTCLLGDRPCSDTQPCSAHEQWQSIHASAARRLVATSVADLIGTDFSAEAPAVDNVSFHSQRYSRRAS